MSLEVQAMVRRSIVTCLLATAMALPVSGSAGDQGEANFLAATGKDTIISVVAGQAICAGGAPTGGAYPYCSQETNATLVRGELDGSILSDVTGSGAELLDGAMNTYVSNCNLDRKLQGPCWGTFEMTVPGQGKWEGTWQGFFDFLNFAASYAVVGRGSGGQLEGKQLKYEAFTDGTTYYALFTARIIGD
jgi:hypothetical protein